MTSRKALVAGASGIVGRHLIDHLQQLGGWEITGLSRSQPQAAGDYRHIPVDLGDTDDCRDKLGGLSDLTHIFFAPRAARATIAEEAAANQRMLENLYDAVVPGASALRHIHLMHGTKWYGSHLGPFRTPAREDDSRHMPPNFYYSQQDFIEARQRGASWTWTALRPHTVCGVSTHYPHNAVGVLAAYGAISRELGLPLRFPGTPACFDSVSQVTDARLLARAMVWAATTPGCAGEAFNLVNDDYYRWRNLWPRLADFFGVEAGPIQQIRLADVMADKGPLWDRMVEKHGLAPYRLDDIANWAYGDFMFRIDWDEMSSTVKIRRHGFHETIETEEMFLELLADYRRRRIIP